jgi:hypothetical protein
MKTLIIETSNMIKQEVNDYYDFSIIQKSTSTYATWLQELWTVILKNNLRQVISFTPQCKNDK